jgi:hypothetical protein
MFKTKLAAVAIAAAAVTTLGVGAGVANAAPSPIVTYTTAGANAVTGYFAHGTNSDLSFTDINSYVGSSGDGSLANLPLATVTGSVHIPGGAGLELCDRTTGQAAQVADVYIGSNLMDVVAATGNMGAALANGDSCENGVVNPTGLNGTTSTSTPAETVTGTETDAAATFTSGGAVPHLGDTVNFTGITAYDDGTHETTGTVTSVSGSTFTLDETSPATPVTVVSPQNGTFTDGTTVIPSTSVTVTPAAAVYTFGTGTGGVPADGTRGTLTGPLGGTRVVDATATTFELSNATNGTPLGSNESGTPTENYTFKTVAVNAVGPNVDHYSVLLTDVPVNDTVDLGILSDAKSDFTFKGHNFGANTVTLTATDLSQPTKSNTANFPLPSGNQFDEADNGVVANTTTWVPLLGVTAPLANGGTLEHSAPNELARFAHVAMDANVVGGSEVHGSLQSTSAWTAYPVAATSNGEASGQLFLAPSTFAADNMYVAGIAS